MLYTNKSFPKHTFVQESTKWGMEAPVFVLCENQWTPAASCYTLPANKCRHFHGSIRTKIEIWRWGIGTFFMWNNSSVNFTKKPKSETWCMSNLRWRVPSSFTFIYNNLFLLWSNAVLAWPLETFCICWVQHLHTQHCAWPLSRKKLCHSDGNECIFQLTKQAFKPCYMHMRNTNPIGQSIADSSIDFYNCFLLKEKFSTTTAVFKYINGE